MPACKLAGRASAWWAWLSWAQHTTEALGAALDTGVAHIRDHAAEPARR